MKTLIVSSTLPYAGKSGVCLALIGLLEDRGLTTTYYKPYGTMPVSEGGEPADQDATYIAGKAEHRLSPEAATGVVTSPGFIEDVLAGRMTEQVAGRVHEEFLAASADSDVAVVEGPSSLAEGQSVGLALCSLTELFDASVLLVDRPHRPALPDEILWAKECLGERLAGVVFNAVPASLAGFMRDAVTPFLERAGVPVFGSVPHDPVLSSVAVSEIVDALGGTVLCCEDRLDEPVESFLVGAMGQDKALRYFRRKARKAVITGGDRADVQLAALETDTATIVLTGSLPPSPLVLSRAEELGVPVVLVPADTLTAVERMESLLGRVRVHDERKAARIRRMFEDAVDVTRLTASIGL